MICLSTFPLSLQLITSKGFDICKFLDNKQSALAWAKSSGGAGVIDSLLTGSFVVPLLGYAYLGTFSRYMADDFAALRTVRAHGFFGAQINWYLKWTGRFSYSFLFSLAGVVGPETPRFMPALLLTLWFLGNVWAIYQIHLGTGDDSRTHVLLFASFIIYATLETAPNLSQSLFWQSAALTHFAPLVLFSVFLGVIYRGIRSKHKRYSGTLNFVCAGLLTFVAGGLGDAYVIFQSSGLIVSILAVEILATSACRSKVRPSLLTGLAGSLLALTIVIASPGNSFRQAFFPRRYGGLQMLEATLWYSASFVAKLVITHPVIVILSLVLPIVVLLRNFNDSTRRSWDGRLCIRLLFLIPAAVLLLIVCCTGASIYAISEMLPERARILLSFVFVCGTFLWSRVAGEYIIGRLLRFSPNIRRSLAQLATIALLLLIPFPLVSFFSVLSSRESARAFASDWDQQDAQLKTAKEKGVTDLTVPQIWDFQSRTGNGQSDLHLRTDSTFWINRVTASYYGLQSISASEDIVISR